MIGGIAALLQTLLPYLATCYSALILSRIPSNLINVHKICFLIFKKISLTDVAEMLRLFDGEPTHLSVRQPFGLSNGEESANSYFDFFYTLFTGFLAQLRIKSE